MGEVHQAEDLLLGTVVALKTLSARFLGSGTAIGRFKQEVAAVLRGTHPNVCRIFELGIDCADEAVGPLMFITMEFIEGRTLASLVDDPILDLLDRTEMGESIRAVITDFGLARSEFGEAPEQIREPGLSGTPVYAAPERLIGQPATAASDIYSFGLVAAEVLPPRAEAAPQCAPESRSDSGTVAQAD